MSPMHTFLTIVSQVVRKLGSPSSFCHKPTTHPPSSTYREEGLALFILAGTSNQTHKLSPFFLFNHKKQPCEKIVVQVWLTLI